MKRIALVALLLCLHQPAVAQSYDPPPQSTSPPVNARFEVIQSPLAARWTFRLDRYAGHVWQLVKTKEDEMTWEETPVLGISRTAASRPHFQIFTSGLAARQTFLVDADTGNTWQLVSEKRRSKDGAEYDNIVWQPFAE